MKATPFLKWVGGKAGLISQYESFLPKEFGTYFEPFLGGGALYFHLAPKRAVLNDANEEVVNAYHAIAHSLPKLIPLLVQHKEAHCEAHYYGQREIHPSALSPLDRAARLIYMNKTGYNGLYRVNLKGYCNVPIGKSKTISIFNPDNLEACSALLKSSILMSGDFEGVSSSAKSGDFVFFDPPYEPMNKTSFTQYTKNGFNWKDRVRLASLVRRLTQKGVLVMLADSDTPQTRLLYSPFNVNTVYAKRSINRNKDGRGEVSELLVTNYKP